MLGRRCILMTTVLVAATCLVATLGGCDYTRVEEPDGIPGCDNPYHPDLLLLVSTVTEIPHGASLPMSLTVTTSAHEETYHFTTSQRYDFSIHDIEDEEVWRWSDDRPFLMVVGDETYTTDAVLYFERLDTGQFQLETGMYTLKATVTTEGTDTEMQGPAHACTTFWITAG